MICKIEGCDRRTISNVVHRCNAHWPKCQHCGEQAAFEEMKTPECANCWEVTRRLTMFLRSEKNRENVLRELAKHNDFEKLLDKLELW